MRAWTVPLMLGLALTTTGCLTRTTGQISLEADAALAARICAHGWPAVSYDSRVDSAPTIDEIRAANRAREAFCRER
jgi:hypothetical protein